MSRKPSARVLRAHEIRSGDQVKIEGVFTEFTQVAEAYPVPQGMRLVTDNGRFTVPLMKPAAVLPFDFTGYTVTLRNSGDCGREMILESVNARGEYEPDTSIVTTWNLEWACLLFEALTGVKPTGELPQSAPRRRVG